MKTSNAIIACILLLAFSLGACAPASTPADPAAAATATPSPDEKPAAPVDTEPAAYTVTDALDRTLTFNAVPERIVLVGRALFMVADALYTFPEAGARIAATGDTGQGIDNNFIALLDPAYAEKQLLSGEAGPEQIAAVNPDAVIMKSYLAETLGAPLEALDIPVVYVNLETPAAYDHDIKTLGQLLQNPARADDVLNYYQTRVDAIDQALSGLDEASKPGVLMLYYSDRDGEIAFNVPPLNWIQTTMVTQAGGRPVWEDANPGQGWTKVSLEQVAAWDPQVILIVSYFRSADEVVAELKGNPEWQALQATQAGQLYAFPGDFYSWDQPDTRWILGQSWLAKTLHPERCADLDLGQELRTFFGTLYNLDDTAINEQIVPLLKGDQ